MLNLTQHLRVVGPEQAGIHPQLGCYLVLLKQVHEGRVFHSVLDPGERPPEPGGLRRFFKEGQDIVSIPVSANTSLRHEFTSSLEHVTPGHAFEVDYLLGFSVGAPEKIATRWTEDPVRRLEEEIRRICDPLARTTDWEQLRANILRDGAAGLYRSEIHEALEDLRPFAEEYGIEMKSLRMTLRLSRADSDPYAGYADVERKEIIEKQEMAKRKAEMAASHELKQLELQHKSEIDRLERLGKPEEWNQEFAELTLDKAKIVLDNIARNINSPEDLIRAVRSFGSIAGMVRNNGVQKALDGTPDMAQLSAVAHNKVEGVVQELSFAIEGMGGDGARRRELMSVFLHLIAEAYRGESGNPEDVERYQARAEDLLASDWGGSLGAAQFKILNQLKDFGTLKERLK